MLNQGQLTLLFASLRAKYLAAYQSAATWSDSILSTEPAEGETYELAWVEVLPGFQKWVKTKTFHGANIRGFKVTNEPWEDSVIIDRRKTMVDLNKFIPQQVEQLAWNVKKFKDEAVKRILQNGKTSGATFDGFSWYDGRPAFAINHPVNIGKPGLGVWPNLHVGRPLDANNLEFGLSAAAGVLAPNGNSWSIVPNVLLVPSTLGQLGKRLTGNDMLGRIFERIAPAGFAAATESNPFDSLQLVIAPELSNEPNVWYLLDTRGGKHPLRHQQVQAPQEAPNNGIMMPHTHEVVYGYEAHGSFFIGEPMAIHRFEG